MILSDGHGHPKPLASHSNAHKKPITCLEFLEDRYMYDDYRINVGGAGETVPATIACICTQNLIKNLMLYLYVCLLGFHDN